MPEIPEGQLHELRAFAKGMLQLCDQILAKQPKQRSVKNLKRDERIATAVARMKKTMYKTQQQ